MEHVRLKWDVFVAPGKLVVTDDVPPGETHALWSPTSSTLVCGERDAVLIDPLLTFRKAATLADWVEASGIIRCIRS